MAVRPRLAPMLARLEHELPRDGYLYEPTWGGCRCLAFRNAAEEVDVRSRNGRPLARYFPELVEALCALPIHPFVLDGEIVVAGDAGLDVEALKRRLHPARSSIRRLREEAPAALVAFDLVEHAALDLRDRPFVYRRRLLERLLARARPSLLVAPLTDDVEAAAEWLATNHGGGVVAKQPYLRYQPGVRAMIEVKREHAGT